MQLREQGAQTRLVSRSYGCGKDKDIPLIACSSSYFTAETLMSNLSSSEECTDKAGVSRFQEPRLMLEIFRMRVTKRRLDEHFGSWIASNLRTASGCSGTEI